MVEKRHKKKLDIGRMFDNDEVIKHGIGMCEQEAKYIGTESLSQAQ